MQPVLQRIREDGPVGAKGFESAPSQRSRTQWSWKTVRLALELIFWNRELMVTEWSNFQKSKVSLREFSLSLLIPLLPITRMSTSSSYAGHLVCQRQSNEIVAEIKLSNFVRGSFRNTSVCYYSFQPCAGPGLQQEGLELVLKYAFRELCSIMFKQIFSPIMPHRSLPYTNDFHGECLSTRYLKIGSDRCDHERWVFVVKDW